MYVSTPKGLFINAVTCTGVGTATYLTSSWLATRHIKAAIAAAKNRLENYVEGDSDFIVYSDFYKEVCKQLHVPVS